MAEMTKPGLSFERVLPIFSLTLVDVLGLTIILPLLHLYAVTFGATPLEIGLVAATYPLCQLVGVPMMGALSDRFGRKPLLLISEITTCISFLMLASATSLGMIVLSRVIDGVFGANLATAQAALTDITTEEQRTQGLGITGAAFGLGFIFGPVIAIVALEFSDSLAIPALIAAVYSFCSVLLTLFTFKETLPSDQRAASAHAEPQGAPAIRRISLFSALRWLKTPTLGLLLLLMFAQQIIFYGFESLLGLFTLNRAGMMGQGNAIIFLFVGVILVMVQVRFIGKWSRRYGDRRLVQMALGLLAIGLLLLAITPQQPHPLYIRGVVARDLATLNPGGTEMIIGDIPVELPTDDQRGIGAIVVIMLAIVPLSVGSGLIRPSLNSLITRQAKPSEYGVVLGASAAFVSAANAVAPLIGGLMFQRFGATAPFWVGGVVMAALWLLSMVKLPQLPNASQPQTR